MSLIVLAIGGNSLIKDAEHQTVQDQYAAIQETASHLAVMAEQGWELVITHGNGPQVGFILRRSELARHELHPVPLDSCGADTQGAIGYQLQKALRGEFRARGIAREPVTVVTLVRVDKDDPAFEKPSKPIGEFLDEATAREREAKEGWKVVEEAERGWRRVVPSPRPRQILEIGAIRTLLEAGFTVIGAGGGGIPVVEEDGQLVGVEAVIDKDYASALLAAELGADLFLISTAVEQVALNYRQPDERRLERLTVAQARRFLDEGQFPPGSMGPKIEAMIWYLERGGKEGLITSPEAIERALPGETGTRLVP